MTAVIDFLVHLGQAGTWLLATAIPWPIFLASASNALCPAQPSCPHFYPAGSSPSILQVRWTASICLVAFQGGKCIPGPDAQPCGGLQRYALAAFAPYSSELCQGRVAFSVHCPNALSDDEIVRKKTDISSETGFFSVDQRCFYDSGSSHAVRHCSHAARSQHQSFY